MTHEEASRRVLEFVYGEMDARAAGEFEALLGTDAELRAEVESIREVRRAAAGLAPEPMPADLKRGLVHAAKARAAMRRRRRRFSDVLERLFLSPAFSGAMVVMVVAAAGGQLMTRLAPAERLAALDAERRSGPVALLPQRPAPRSAGEAPAVSTVAANATATPGVSSRPVVVGGKGAGDVPEVSRAQAAIAARSEEAADQRGRVAGRLRQPDLARALGQGMAERAPVAALSKAKAGKIQDLSSDAPSVDGSRRTSGFFASPPPAPAAAPMPASKPLVQAPVAPAPAEKAAAPADNAPAAGFARATEDRAAPASGSTAAEERQAAGPVATAAVAKKEAPATGEPRAALARARRLKADGRLDAALAAYRKAAAGLSGDDLRSALREAAAVASTLHRDAEARDLEKRAANVP